MLHRAFVSVVLFAATASFGQNAPTETLQPAPGAQQAPAVPPASASLGVGDKAPALSIDKWVKGEPVNEFTKTRIYVVEFWATWCGPCRKSIPHLTELQGRYKDKVTVIGVSSQEPKGLSDVEPFVAKQGDKMAYTVAWDDAGKTSKAWMDAAGQMGIPTAFVVNQDARIAWIGHPMDGLDDVLDRMVTGKFDLDKETAKARHRTEIEAKAAPLIAKAQESISNNDPAAALKVMDDIIALDPEVMGEWAFYKFQLLAGEMKEYTKAYAFARKAVDGPLKDNAGVLNALAWMILDEPGLEKRDLDLAKAAAARANDLTGEKDPAIIDTLAKACFEMGDAQKAIVLQTKAVGLAPEGSLRDELQKRLDEYQKRAAQDGKN